MADGYIQVSPDSTGKKLDTEEITRPSDGAVVERERIVLQRTGDASSTMRPEVASPPLLSAVRLAVAQLGEIRKTVRQRVAVAAEIRRSVFKGAGQHLLRMTGLESLAVAQAEMPNEESARSGQRFLWSTTCANGATNFAPVQTLSNTPTWSLYNSAPAGGPTIFLDVVSFCLYSGTSAAGATLMATVSQTPLIANSSGGGSSSFPFAGNAGIASCSGSRRKSYGVLSATSSVAYPFFTSAGGNTQLGIPWVALISAPTLAAANVGQPGGTVSLGGALAIPPGHAVGFCILSGAGTTPLFYMSGTFVERQADME